MRECSKCAYDIDAVSAVPCFEHVWHNYTWSDMCCKCGKDAEMLLK